MNRHVKQDLNAQNDSDFEDQCVYQADMWKTMLEQESEKPPLHLHSPQLVFRGTLVQFLRDLTKKLDLGLPTLHSAVAQLDLFMDGHRLRGDRLVQITLACLSIAAKSEEKSSRAPSLTTLSKISGVQLYGEVFKQLEWMVGEHAKWKLLAPTVVSFAALLTQFVVMDGDCVTRHPRFVRRYKREGAKLLNMYLDLTLSDVRLKLMQSVDVACACVVCARTDLGLQPWPEALASAAGRPYTTVAPIARRLQRMMQVMTERRGNTDTEVDQGYGSAKTTPNQTPCTSPKTQVSPNSNSSNSNNSERYRPVTGQVYSVLDIESAAALSRNRLVVQPEYSVIDTESSESTELPGNSSTVPTDRCCPTLAKYCQFCRSSRLINAGLVPQTDNVVIKRPADTDVDYENKRCRLAVQMSQTVL